MEKKDKKVPAVAVVMKAMLISYVLTGILLAVLAAFLYKWNLDENKAAVGILLIYIITSFAGGFTAGKMSGYKKYMWGLFTGIGYILLLTLVSLCVNRGIEGSVGSYFITAVMCSASAMFGGMLS